MKYVLKNVGLFRIITYGSTTIQCAGRRQKHIAL